MTEAQPRAFMLSATLHAAAAAIVLFFTYAVSRNSEPPKIIDLVAGPGDDIMAREAPAAGREGGAVKVPLNTPQPQPEPQPVAPVQPEPPPPVTKAPPPQPAKTTPVPTDAPVPNFKKQITQDVRNADRKAKRELAKQHAEEEKQKQAEKKRQEEEAKKMSKEDFDKKYGKNAKVASASPPKSSAVKKINVDDVLGVNGGVNGGSSASKKGAGGKALKNDNDDVMAAYYALIQQKLRKEFEPPPGLADTLKVDIELWSNADGSLTKVRVAKSSGSKEFDQSVLDAIRRMKMPARPDKKSEEIVFTFTMRERGEG